MRKLLVVLWMLCCSVTAAFAQVSVGIGFNIPGLSIGINLPAYPDMVPVPGYPVYYAPQANSNYFFYDGMYWVFQGDNWYASSWYNGPWGMVDAEAVPLFVLRVPVRYYRQPPTYFRGWASDAPPHWGEHWGSAWDQRHRGWDNWDRRSAHAPAPLPTYQKQYSGNRYPAAEQQHVLQSKNYRYQPRDAVVQQHYQRAQNAPAPSAQGRQEQTQQRVPAPPERRTANRQPPPQQIATPAPQADRPAPRQEQQSRQEQPSRQVAVPHEQPAREPQQADAPHGNQAKQAKGQEKDQEKNQDKGQGKGRDKGDQREGERDK
jgi:hypothetical protein